MPDVRPLVRDLLAGVLLLTYPVRHALDWILHPYRARRADRIRRERHAATARSLADRRRKRMHDARLAAARQRAAVAEAARDEKARLDRLFGLPPIDLTAPGDRLPTPSRGALCDTPFAAYPIPPQGCDDWLPADYLWGSDGGSCSSGDSSSSSRSED